MTLVDTNHFLFYLYYFIITFLIEVDIRRQFCCQFIEDIVTDCIFGLLPLRIIILGIWHIL